MNRFSKAILIALGVLAALVVGVMVCVNLYLQSPGVQTRIQDELSRVLGMPLTITSTSFTPWSDLRISGITIRNGDTDLLNVASFNARYRIGPLLDRKLVIYKVTLDSPKIVWKQDAEGRWTLPKKEKSSAPKTESTEATEEPKTEATAKAEKPPKAKRELEVVVESGQITHGTIELLDSARQPIAMFSDVTLDFTKLTPGHIEGTAKIGRIAWEKVLVAEEVSTPFSYLDNTLEITALDARIGSGFVKGKVTVKTSDKATPFAGNLEFEYIDLARIGADAGWTDTDIAGSVRGTLNLAGTVREWARSEGNAKLFLRNGRFRNMLYFELIGQALQIKELSDLRLGDSQADVRFADEKAFIEAMTLDATNLQLSGTGLLRIDGKIQVAARLTARERLFKELPGFARDNFATAEDASRYIDFTITGKTAKPKTDLLNKVVGKKIETQFDDLLSSLFKTNPKDDEKKKKDDKKKDDKRKKKKDEGSENGVKPAVPMISAPDGADQTQ